MCAELTPTITTYTGADAYTVEQVLHEVIQHARELRLRCVRGQHEVRAEALEFLTALTMRYLHQGPDPVAL